LKGNIITVWNDTLTDVGLIVLFSLDWLLELEQMWKFVLCKDIFLYNSIGRFLQNMKVIRNKSSQSVVGRAWTCKCRALGKQQDIVVSD